MDRFPCIDAFVRAAQTQSFAQAARLRRLSKSVVTTRVLRQFIESLGKAALAGASRPGTRRSSSVG
ncbi:hypothetical protein [Azohydromonas caseinilytica]|uniref:Regulatory helix-turn-helix protein, lysR family n=1 Tax=Azohydromonas caseinilytica TaxID=2728836 RepID=A0A848FDI7_9BURK|nr:hypothetical protein [Azohydromonas caseinilytica]